MARGVALFLGAFTLLNLAGSLRVPGFDLNLWWVDLRALPVWLADGFLGCAGFLLLWFAVRPPLGGARRLGTAACLALLLIAALGNSVTYYQLVRSGVIGPALPVPLSLGVAAGLALLLRVLLRNREPGRGRELTSAVAVAGLMALVFPLLQMVFFGKTDYRRPADVVVVMGARVYADGRLSDALQDRVRTACELYRQGLVTRLIMSGGPGDGAMHEAEAMGRAAVRLGVKSDDIVLDRSGLNTEHTVKNTCTMLRAMGPSRVLVVSHGYHLPRIKLAYQRAGIEVYTVPARETYFLRQLPFNMAREVAAIWVYYFRPLMAA